MKLTKSNDKSQFERVVYIDAGTGRGGASRSLYYLASSIREKGFKPHVILLSGNPLTSWYERDGIEYTELREIPRFRPGQRKNFVAFAHFIWRMRYFPHLLFYTIRALRGKAGLLHANHENLAITVWLISRIVGRPWICHVRTKLVDTFSARSVYRFINRKADGIIFISSGAFEHFRKLARASEKKKHYIIFNSYSPNKSNGKKLVLGNDPHHAKLRVLTLSSLTPNRGIDRQLDVAAELKRRGVNDILFIVCGAPQGRTPRPSFKPSYADFLIARAADEDLRGIVEFLGHLKFPEIALKSCDVLLKLGRENSPWGRDIIEAMAFGLPVVTLGSEGEFIRNGENGFIDRDFCVSRVADHLIFLRDCGAVREKIGERNREIANDLFRPEIAAQAMSEIYKELD
jgi:glycosyltransferase involved in cell wall biosynthesis